MKTYELTYIISSALSSEEAGSVATEVDSFLQSKEGVILKSERPVAKALAYPIKKMGSGYFVISEFQLEPEKLIEVKEMLEKDAKVLRSFILVKNPVRIRKERRTKKVFATPELETKLEQKEPAPAESFTEAKEEKTSKKTDLSDIDKKLDELLGE